MTKRAVISVHTDPDIAERLDRLARGRGQTRSSLAAEALVAFLEGEEAWQARVAERLRTADDPDAVYVSSEDAEAILHQRIRARAKEAS